MRKTTKQLFFAMLLLFSAGIAVAQEPAGFVIEIEPSSFEVNIPVDVTIKVVKSNGDVVKDYDGIAYIGIDETILEDDDYDIPSEGLYEFVPQDQGVKKFSKGLVVKKAGTFTIVAYDINNDAVKGEKTIIVGGATKPGTLKPILINTPAKNGVEKTDVLEVIGGISDLPNSTIEIYLNNQIVYEGMTDNVGGFTAYLTGYQQGENTFQAKILDANNVVLGESESIPFTYTPISDGKFNSIQVLPSNLVRAGEKTTFRVSTSDTISSAVLRLSNGRSAPMDPVSPGVFSKEMVIDTQGKIDVSVDIFIDGQKQAYDKVTKVFVGEGTKIGKVRIFGDPSYKNKVTLTWDVEGTEPPKYKVTFGKEENTLNESTIVTKKEAILEDLSLGSKYYFRIIPLSANGEVAGSSSEIVNTTIGDTSESSCTVQGISVKNVVIGDQHYLIRSGVQNVEKYIIYRSERETTDITKMQKVAEVTEPRYEYPFNKEAAEDKYEYFGVQAICKDGKTLVIKDIKKVKTGPVDSFLLLIFISILFYSSYRLLIVDNK